jgi:hypothetical protein
MRFYSSPSSIIVSDALMYNGVQFCLVGRSRACSAACEESNFATLPKEVEQRLEACRRWVVFSDLHVHQRHSPYWRDALAAVQAAASELQAGCIFLVRHATVHYMRSPHALRTPSIMLTL